MGGCWGSRQVTVPFCGRSGSPALPRLWLHGDTCRAAGDKVTVPQGTRVLRAPQALGAVQGPVRSVDTGCPHPPLSLRTRVGVPGSRTGVAASSGGEHWKKKGKILQFCGNRHFLLDWVNESMHRHNMYKTVILGLVWFVSLVVFT